MSSEDLKILAEDIVDFCNALESACVKLRRQIEKLLGSEVRANVSEVAFTCLKWEDERGARLGNYQVAYKNSNLLDKWLHAYRILEANHAVISNPFKLEGYEHRYWIYPEKYKDRIFRKKLKGRGRSK